MNIVFGGETTTSSLFLTFRARIDGQWTLGVTLQNGDRFDARLANVAWTEEAGDVLVFQPVDDDGADVGDLAEYPYSEVREIEVY
jgi:hypothetical protein